MAPSAPATDAAAVARQMRARQPLELRLVLAHETLAPVARPWLAATPLVQYRDPVFDGLLVRLRAPAGGRDRDDGPAGFDLVCRAAHLIQGDGIVLIRVDAQGSESRIAPEELIGGALPYPYVVAAPSEHVD